MTKKDASKQLTQHIREMASEKIEVDGKEMTRAKALAYQMWQAAQGYDEITRGGQTIRHPPDKIVMNQLIDRLEGKVATADTKGNKPKATVADRVKEQSRLRLKNALAKGPDDSSSRNSKKGYPKAPTQGTIS